MKRHARVLRGRRIDVPLIEGAAARRPPRPCRVKASGPSGFNEAPKKFLLYLTEDDNATAVLAMNRSFFVFV